MKKGELRKRNKYAELVLVPRHYFSQCRMQDLKILVNLKTILGKFSFVQL